MLIARPCQGNVERVAQLVAGDKHRNVYQANGKQKLRDDDGTQ